MQMEFDITNLELANLKRKIGQLDPVTQAEKVVEYLDGNYTQKQLGEKLGKSRDWIGFSCTYVGVKPIATTSIARRQ